MTKKNDANWLANFEALKAHVIETGHFPNKHDKSLCLQYETGKRLGSKETGRS